MLWSPLEQFEIIPVLSFELGKLNITFNSFTIYAISYTLILATILCLYIQNLKILIEKGNLFFIQIYKIILNLILSNSKDLGNLYYPYFLALFFILFISNVFGLIPWGYTLTSQIITTMILSFIFFFAINYIAILRHSYKISSLFMPSGTPFLIMPLIVPIEILSYMSRLFSLAIRLFANMMSGHTLLHILLSFVYKFYFSSLFFAILTIIPLIVINGIFLMEIGIAFLQIYVFIVLSTLYLSDTYELSH